MAGGRIGHPGRYHVISRLVVLKDEFHLGLPPIQIAALVVALVAVEIDFGLRKAIVWIFGTNPFTVTAVEFQRSLCDRTADQDGPILPV